MIANFRHKIFVTVLLLALYNILAAQPHEYHFTFTIGETTNLDSLSQMISIDKIDKGLVWAYASPKEMETFKCTGIKYELCPDDKASKASYLMAKTIDQMQNWDRYPTYSVYDSIMHKFANDHPDICNLEVVGTLASGRQILAISISGNGSIKPKVLYTSTMHGNEVVGMVTTLRLCHYLTSNYSTSEYIKNLVDNTEIWIIPLLNPDGTYRGGDNTISGSIRGNGNSVDLNRNYPHINETNPHPDGNTWQQETLSMMDFFKKHHFSLSANIHGGNECFNYPWDTWSKRTADNNWWKMIGQAYRDTTQKYSPAGYFDDGLNQSANGLTNGWDWYSVTGGQQDYANYYEHCREATIEICSSKIASSSTLPSIWEYNYRSMLNYIAEATNGLHGVISDTYGHPIKAQVTITDHDIDNSWVESDPQTGAYHRYLKEGTYSLTFTAEGFKSKTVNATVADGKCTVLNVILEYDHPVLQINPTSLTINMQANSTARRQVTLKHTEAWTIEYSIDDSILPEWMYVNNNRGSISSFQEDTVELTFDSHGLLRGSHFATLKFTSVSQTVKVDIELNITISDTLPSDNDSIIGTDTTIVNTDTSHVIADTSIVNVDTVINIDSIITKPTIKSIIISALPYKTEYYIGEVINTNGGMLRVTYSNDSTATIAIKPDMIDNFNSSTEGTVTLKVSIDNCLTFFSIFVKKDNTNVADTAKQPKPVLKSIALASFPAKLDYQIGDTLSLSGGMLRLTFSNDSTATIAMKSTMIDNFDSSTEGTVTLTVKYGTLHTSFNIYVRKPGTGAEDTTILNGNIIKSIDIAALPAKLDYQIGDTLSLSGGMLRLTFSNDSSAYIPIESCTVTGYDSECIGSKTIIITYKGFSLYFFVNVNGTDDTAIDGLMPDRLAITVSDMHIIIENAPSNVMIFNQMGQLVAKAAKGNSQISVSKGLYIIKIGSYSQHIVVK